MSILQPQSSEESLTGSGKWQKKHREPTAHSSCSVHQPHPAPFPWAETSQSRPEGHSQSHGEAAPGSKPSAASSGLSEH